jgi:hypothetical protein
MLTFIRDVPFDTPAATQGKLRDFGQKIQWLERLKVSLYASLECFVTHGWVWHTRFVARAINHGTIRVNTNHSGKT